MAAGASGPAAPGPAGATLVPGMRLQQRYVLRGRIGRGGMSEVWHAHDEVLRRGVAVKALSPALAADPPLRAAIRAEARLVARLNHPHITQVYDYGEVTVDDGTVVSYLVMELVAGRTLAARLALGRLPWQEAVRVAGQVAAALHEAHSVGLVHRDIKPANVMLTPIGAKVLDFGIAALAGTGGRAETPRIGTPAYAAPERLAAAPTEPASDVYSVGALLYEALTGRPPVPVHTWGQAAEAHRRTAPVAPPEVPGLPDRLAVLCLRCLAADPRRRPPAGQVAAALGVRPPASAPTRTHAPTLIDPAPVPPARRAGAARWWSAARVTVPRGPGAGRPRWAAFGVLGVVAAGVLAVALLGAWLLDGRGAARDAVAAPPRVATPADNSATSIPPGAVLASPGPGTAGDQPTVPPDATAAPGPPAGAPPPAEQTPRAVVTAFERELAQAAAAGLVREDVALDLRNGLVNMRTGIEAGRTGEVRVQAAQLRQKLDVRLAERAIDAATAQRLAAVLDPLLA